MDHLNHRHNESIRDENFTATAQLEAGGLGFVSPAVGEPGSRVTLKISDNWVNSMYPPCIVLPNYQKAP